MVENLRIYRDEVNIWRPGQTGISTDLLQIDLTSEMFRRFGIRISLGGQQHFPEQINPNACASRKNYELRSGETFLMLNRFEVNRWIFLSDPASKY